MTDTAMIERIDALTTAVISMASIMGTRLDKDAMSARMGIHRNTLRERLASDSRMPRPRADGKWLLSDVLAWEAGK